MNKTLRLLLIIVSTVLDLESASNRSISRRCLEFRSAMRNPCTTEENEAYYRTLSDVSCTGSELTGLRTHFKAEPVSRYIFHF